MCIYQEADEKKIFSPSLPTESTDKMCIYQDADEKKISSPSLPAESTDKMCIYQEADEKKIIFSPSLAAESTDKMCIYREANEKKIIFSPSLAAESTDIQCPNRGMQLIECVQEFSSIQERLRECTREMACSRSAAVTTPSEMVQSPEGKRAMGCRPKSSTISTSC
jgi:hypothetical protein